MFSSLEDLISRLDTVTTALPNTQIGFDYLNKMSRQQQLSLFMMAVLGSEAQQVACPRCGGALRATRDTIIACETCALAIPIPGSSTYRFRSHSAHVKAIAETGVQLLELPTVDVRLTSGEIRSYIDAPRVVRPDQKGVYVRAPKGAGKTRMLRSYIEGYEGGVIVISNRVSVVRRLAEDLDLPFYQDNDARPVVGGSFVVCINSTANYLSQEHFQGALVIIDEATQVKSDLAAPVSSSRTGTMNIEVIHRNMDLFRSALPSVGGLLCLDADMDLVTVQFWNGLLQIPNGHSALLHLDLGDERHFVEVMSQQAMVQLTLSALADGAKVYCPCEHLSVAKGLAEKIAESLPSTKVFLATSEGRSLNGEDVTRQADLDLNSFVANNDVQCIIHTGVYGNGTSIDDGFFVADAAFCFLSSDTLGPKEADQLIRRVRTVRRGVYFYNVSFSTRDADGSDALGLDGIRSLIYSQIRSAAKKASFGRASNAYVASILHSLDSWQLEAMAENEWYLRSVGPKGGDKADAFRQYVMSNKASHCYISKEDADRLFGQSKINKANKKADMEAAKERILASDVDDASLEADRNILRLCLEHVGSKEAITADLVRQVSDKTSRTTVARNHMLSRSPQEVAERSFSRSARRAALGWGPWALDMNHLTFAYTIRPTMGILKIKDPTIDSPIDNCSCQEELDSMKDSLCAIYQNNDSFRLFAEMAGFRDLSVYPVGSDKARHAAGFFISEIYKWMGVGGKSKPHRAGGKLIRCFSPDPEQASWINKAIIKMEEDRAIEAAELAEDQELAERAERQIKEDEERIQKREMDLEQFSAILETTLEAAPGARSLGLW